MRRPLVCVCAFTSVSVVRSGSSASFLQFLFSPVVWQRQFEVTHRSFLKTVSPPNQDVSVRGVSAVGRQTLFCFCGSKLGMCEASTCQQLDFLSYQEQKPSVTPGKPHTLKYTLKAHTQRFVVLSLNHVWAHRSAARRFRLSELAAQFGTIKLQ